ncbi:hypothetical protein HUU05_17005 [candidate division KSB1 bacterium]|nr:hypothetical protein [candidate division KSB1 bacterium]
MNFAKRVFRIAGIYGLLVIAPMYFAENQMNRDFPPAITHPEHFYGFIGVTLAWQIAFLVIAGNPSRFRSMMLPAMVEKFSCIAIFILYAQQRVPFLLVGFGLIDLVLGILFVFAFLRTPKI